MPFSPQNHSKHVITPGSHASKASSTFPKTTTQEMHSADIFERHKIMNRTNFKKANSFSAYANALFNGGVFIHPPED